MCGTKESALIVIHTAYLIEEIKKSKDFYGVSGEISEVALNMLLLWYLLFMVTAIHKGGLAWTGYRSNELFLLCFGILRSSWHVGQDGYTEVLGFSCSASVNHLPCRNLTRKNMEV